MAFFRIRHSWRQALVLRPTRISWEMRVLLIKAEMEKSIIPTTAWLWVIQIQILSTAGPTTSRLRDLISLSIYRDPMATTSSISNGQKQIYRVPGEINAGRYWIAGHRATQTQISVVAAIGLADWRWKLYAGKNNDAGLYIHEFPVY